LSHIASLKNNIDNYFTLNRSGFTRLKLFCGIFLLLAAFNVKKLNLLVVKAIKLLTSNNN